MQNGGIIKIPKKIRRIITLHEYEKEKLMRIKIHN